MNNSNVLAIIPARGGSKRLPRKNLLPLAGKPMIAWSIEAALNSNAVDEVIVSTEDPEIAEISRMLGADVPFMRPSELASDTADSIDVVLDILSKLPLPKRVVLLQPTSPLRTSKHIDEAILLMDRMHANAIVSVCKENHPLEWINTLPPDGNMDNFLQHALKKRRSQDLPDRYRINGAIYITDALKLCKQKTFFLSQGTYAYIMDSKSSVDVDQKTDFIMAEILKLETK